MAVPLMMMTVMMNANNLMMQESLRQSQARARTVGSLSSYPAEYQEAWDAGHVRHCEHCDGIVYGHETHCPFCAGEED